MFQKIIDLFNCFIEKSEDKEGYVFQFSYNSYNDTYRFVLSRNYIHNFYYENDHVLDVFRLERSLFTDDLDDIRSRAGEKGIQSLNIYERKFLEFDDMVAEELKKENEDDREDVYVRFEH